jgi:hypothetical protein
MTYLAIRTKERAQEQDAFPRTRQSNLAEQLKGAIYGSMLISVVGK